MKYVDRAYRNIVASEDLVTFEVKVGQTDLAVSAKSDLRNETTKLVEKYRSQIEEYIEQYPDFGISLSTHDKSGKVSPIVNRMCAISKKLDVGPMAAVAGAIAEFVGTDLLRFSDEVIVENGGDDFIVTKKKRKVAVFAGKSKFNMKLAVEINPEDSPIGICTSSGTVGHSLSFGKADAVVVLAKSCALADGIATKIGNLVFSEEDIDFAIDEAKKIDGLKGIIIIKDDRLGVWGDIKLSGIPK